MDADGATDIQDLEKLYDALQQTEIESPLFEGKIGAAIGSRYYYSIL